MPMSWQDAERTDNGGAEMGEVILEMKKIDKTFPGVHALDHVDFRIKSNGIDQTFSRIKKMF